MLAVQLLSPDVLFVLKSVVEEADNMAGHHTRLVVDDDIVAHFELVAVAGKLVVVVDIVAQFDHVLVLGRLLAAAGTAGVAVVERSLEHLPVLGSQVAGYIAHLVAVIHRLAPVHLHQLRMHLYCICSHFQHLKHFLELALGTD